VRSRPSTPEYRENWERVFGKKKDPPDLTLRFKHALYGMVPVSPHDADDHPKAD